MLLLMYRNNEERNEKRNEERNEECNEERRHNATGRMNA